MVAAVAEKSGQFITDEAGRQFTAGEPREFGKRDNYQREVSSPGGVAVCLSLQ